MRLFGSLAALVVLSAYCVSAQGVIYSYDSAGRLMSANYGAAGTVTYTCDAAGRLITRAAPAPVLAIAKSHSGNFTQGQSGAYTITVSNTGNGPTNAAVQVSDTLPAGLTAASVQTTGWTCAIGPPVACNRSDALGATASYAAITVMVNVAANAPASVTNTATVSGGGAAAGATANDATYINPGGAPAWKITKTHTGNFTQGQAGATYTITVSNTGAVATSGAAQVSDTLPTGLTAASVQATGWTCSMGPPVSCSRSDPLAAGGSYAAITVMVNVAANTPASVHQHGIDLGSGHRRNERQRSDYDQPRRRARVSYHQDSQRKLHAGTERRGIYHHREQHRHGSDGRALPGVGLPACGAELCVGAGNQLELRAEPG